MTSPELAEEVLDDPELLRARDPRGLLPAVAGAGAQVRETAALTAEAGLGRSPTPAARAAWSSWPAGRVPWRRPCCAPCSARAAR